jgi:hypothetical protein
MGVAISAGDCGVCRDEPRFIPVTLVISHCEGHSSEDVIAIVNAVLGATIHNIRLQPKPISSEQIVVITQATQATKETT